MTYLKRFFQGMTFTHLLLYFNALSILILILVLLWNNTDYSFKSTSPTPQNIEVYCPIQNATCVIDTKLGTVELSVDSLIQPLIPFNITLKSSNSSLTKAVIRFEGLDDYMGINQFKFTPHETNNQLWTMRGSIPVCTIDSKTWRVTLNLKNEDDNQFSSHWFKLKII